MPCLEERQREAQARLGPRALSLELGVQRLQLSQLLCGGHSENADAHHRVKPLVVLVVLRVLCQQLLGVGTTTT